MGSGVTYRCEECGKALASEGGYEIHMAGHAAEDQAAEKKAAEHAALAMSAPVFDRPKEKAARTRAAMPWMATAPGAKTESVELLLGGLALATAVLFIVSLAAIVHPSMIRDTRRSASLAATGSPAASAPGSSPSGGTANPGPSTAPTSAPPTSQAVADDVRVRSLILAAGDFSPGWSFTPGGNLARGQQTAGGQAAAQNYATCTGASGGGIPNAQTDGPDATQGPLLVSSSAALFGTEAEARQDFATFTGPSALPCFKQGLVDSLVGQGIPASALTVTSEHVSMPTGRVTSAGLRLIATVTGPGGTVSFYLDLIGLQFGRSESLVTFVSKSGRFPLDVEQTLVLRLAQKDLGVDGVPA